jgi:hypothetical protein
MVVIQAEGASLRYRDDGSDPTATVGMLLADGASMAYTGDMTKLKFFSATGKVNLAFYRET